MRSRRGGKRKRRRRGGKLSRLTIDEERIVKADVADGSRFKGYEDSYVRFQGRWPCLLHPSVSEG